MGTKASKDELDPQRRQELLKMFKNKKISEEFLRDLDELKEQRKQNFAYGGGTSNPIHNKDLSAKNYHSNKPSRLQIDVNDPLLIATLPPPLTSVIHENNEIAAQLLHRQQKYHQQQQQQQQQPPPPPLIPPTHLLPSHQMRNTFNVAKIHHLNNEFIDRNFTDPWRNVSQKIIPQKNHDNISSKKPTRSLLLQELLECPICMNRYDNPHVLPCQHTFCKSCIITVKSNSRNNDDNKISCPICRETHNLVNGVDNLPANYTMKRLIELEAMAAEKEAIELANIKSKRKTTKVVPNMKKIIEKSNSSFSSNQSNTTKYNKKYQKQEFSNYTQHNDIANQDHLKLILLCHSSALDTQSEINSERTTSDVHNYDRIDNNSNSSNDDIQQNNKNEEIYEDEYGKCKTFSKIGVRFDDRIEKIKKIVEEKFQIPYMEQLLVYKDKILKNDQKQLKAYHIRNYGRIHVFDKRDVNENLDDIDPYSIDEEFVKELANNYLPKNNNRKKNIETISLNESLNYNRDDVYSTRRQDRRSPSIKTRNYGIDHNESIYENNNKSRSQFVFEKQNNNNNNNNYSSIRKNYSSHQNNKNYNIDTRKNSISSRRVRMLNELLDSSTLMYSK